MLTVIIGTLMVASTISVVVSDNRILHEKATVAVFCTTDIYVHNVSVPLEAL